MLVEPSSWQGSVVSVRTVIASAPGKVNLHFGVGSLDLDGYHDVVSVYQALNLRERVTVSRSRDSAWSIAVAGTIAADQLELCRHRPAEHLPDLRPAGPEALRVDARRLLEPQHTETDEGGGAIRRPFSFADLCTCADAQHYEQLLEL